VKVLVSFIIPVLGVKCKSNNEEIMNTFYFAVLTAIQANNSRFSWYQLDRELVTHAGCDPGVVSKDLMTVLRELQQTGYISVSAGHNPAQPLYSITPAGQEQLQAHSR